MTSETQRTMKLNVKLNRNLGFIGAALALGLIAAWMAVRYINQEVAVRMPAPQATRQVVVPQHPLAPGSTLGQDDVAARSVPADFVPADALTPDDYQQYMGAVLRAPLAQGAPIPASALVRSVDRFSELIRPGHVAYTLPVSEANSISGLIVPGDHVDLLLVVGDTKGDIRPLLADVPVLATGHEMEGSAAAPDGSDGPSGQGSSSYSDITLELTPRQAQRLGLALKVGNLSVLLRRPHSMTRFKLDRLSTAQLLRVGNTRSNGIQYIIGGAQ